MAQMTMGQWRRKLGDAIALEQAPDHSGMSSIQVLRAVKTGKVPLHTFRASDGRVFRMVKTRDLQAFQEQNPEIASSSSPAPQNLQPQITMQGMKAALREMTKG